MSFGSDWTCSCGWANLDVRPKCRNCRAANPNYTPIKRGAAPSPSSPAATGGTVLAGTHYQAMELAASRLEAAANTLEKLGFPFEAARARDDANMFHVKLDAMENGQALAKPASSPAGGASGLDFLHQRRGELVIERDVARAAVEDLIAAIGNDGKMTSLHDWNERMQRAVVDAKTAIARDVRKERIALSQSTSAGDS